MSIRSTAALSAILVSSGFAFGDVITRWDFNGPSSTTVPGGSSSPTPSTGAGTAGLLGALTGSFSSGTANGGSGDPTAGSPPNFGWQTTGYAAQGTENGQRGVVFFVSTVGFTDIAVSFDTRHSNTSSRFVRFDWSSNGGGTWNNGNVFEAASGGDTWYNGRASGLLPAAASNNAAFAFRMVQVFAPGTSAYAPATSTSTYAGSGTLRWDYVTVTGITPAPATAALIGLAGLAASRRRR